jgi:hypothetical protein
VAEDLPQFEWYRECFHPSQSFSLGRDFILFRNLYLLFTYYGEKMIYKRLTLIAGHYGSGKTNIAVNMAFDLKSFYNNVAIVDLDIVNPYFRTKDSQDELEKSGIRLICSEYANSNVDIPALPQDVYSIVDDKNIMAVVDIGGDDRGAYALGRYAPGILAENDYAMLFVINYFRPLTRTAKDVIAVMHEIESAGGIKFTGIINNSNLGVETKAEDVMSSISYAEEVSVQTGLPIVMTCAETSICEELKDKIPNLFPLNLQEKII